MKLMVHLLALLGYIVIAKCSLSEPTGAIKATDEISTDSRKDAVQKRSPLDPIVVAETPNLSVVSSVSPLLFKVNNIYSEAVSLPLPQDLASVEASVNAVPLVPTVTSASATHTIEIIEQDPHIIETEIVDAPVNEPLQSSDLVGPSGSISIRGSSSIVSGPASTTISEPAKILIAAPVASVVPVVASITTPLFAAQALSFIHGVAASSPAPPLTPTIIVEPPDISTKLHNEATLADLGNIGVNIQKTVTPVIQLPNRGTEYILSSSIAPPYSTSKQILSSTSPAPYSSRDFGHTDSTTIPHPHLSLNEQISTLTTPQYLLSTTPEPPRVFGPAIQVQPQLSEPNQLNIVQPASSYGVINKLDNSEQLSTFPQTVVVSSTVAPLKDREVIGKNLQQPLVHNGQLNIYPSNIPSRNIIPPEIGRLPPLPKEALDLETTFDVSSVPKGSIYSPSIQRISNADNTIAEGKLEEPDQNLPASFVPQINSNSLKIVEGSDLYSSTGSSVPLLTNTRPIAGTIPREGILGSQLAKQGIDSSKIILTKVPLSSVTPLSSDSALLPNDGEYQDTYPGLLNRYGRGVNNKH